MKLEVKLKNPMPPLFIPYPKNFVGRKSGGIEDKSFSISTVPSVVTEPEVELAQKYIAQINTANLKQSLIFTGATFLYDDDPLKTADHAALNEYEQANGLPSSEFLPNNTQLAPYERALGIREKEARTKYKTLLR